MQHANGAPSRDDVLKMLEVSNLVHLPNVYVYLNSLVRHTKVRLACQQLATCAPVLVSQQVVKVQL
jgi:hypothetical protein